MKGDFLLLFLSNLIVSMNSSLTVLHTIGTISTLVLVCVPHRVKTQQEMKRVLLRSCLSSFSPFVNRMDKRFPIYPRFKLSNSFYYHHNKQSSKKSALWKNTFQDPVFEFLHHQRSLTALWFVMLQEKREEQGYLRQGENKTLHHFSKNSASNMKTKLKILKMKAAAHYADLK
uniref:Uncharacterized protein n=1 Tax=Aquila chrysaetos chrysaetos TaxID=223781 RepID=A0A663DRG1_AQUCH